MATPADGVADKQAEDRMRVLERKRPGDGLLWLCLAVGVALVMASIAPGAAWRIHKNNGEFGRRWIWDRTFSLMTVGSQQDTQMGWHHMSRRVCERYADMVTVKDADVLQRAIEKSVLESHEHPMIGGAFFGCESWDICKEHVAARCVNYSAFMVLGFACAGSLLLSAFCGVLALLNKAAEGKCEFMDELQETQHGTFLRCMASAILAGVTTIAWTVRSAELIGALQETGYFPMPILATAFKQAAGGSLLLLLAALVAFWRQAHTWQERYANALDLRKKRKKAAKELATNGAGGASGQIAS